MDTNIVDTTMNWFRKVQQKIRTLQDQNIGYNTVYTYREQMVIGTTKHFTVYSITNGKIFVKMPRLSMYIDVGEAKALRDILSASIGD